MPARRTAVGGLLGAGLLGVLVASNLSRGEAERPQIRKPPAPRAASVASIAAEDVIAKISDGDTSSWRADLEAALTDVSERDLLAWLDDHTEFEPADATGLRDVHAYVLRLAEIGLGETDADTAPGEIRFARFLESDGRPKRTARAFEPNAGRLFALFPEPRDGTGFVTVRWARVGTRTPLLLGREPLAAGRDGAERTLWLRPQNGWEPGEYRVDVYTGDEAARPFATGTYRIRG